MKDDSPPETEVPADNLFIDAALAEQARLGGSGDDSALVRSILLETVERPSAAGEIVHPSPAIDRRSWLLTAVSVAAVVALLIAVLSNLPVRDSRQEEEVIFLVQYVEEGTPDRSLPPAKSAAKSTGPLEDTVGIGTPDFLESPTLAAIDPDWELTTFFGQSIQDFAPRTMRRASFRIEADHAIDEDEEKIYTGNVIVHYEGFRVEADQLRVAKASHSGVSSEANSVTGSNVILRQDHPERLVKAEKIEFLPLSGSLVLSRVKEFSGESEEEIDVGDKARIVLTSNSISLQENRGN